MQNQTPVTDYKKTKGLIYFARMLDKIRLHAAGRLADGYFVGVEDPTFFDSRCTRLLGVDYDELAKRGWRDEGSADLVEAKKRAGWENRDDIQTWVDLHDAEEGRTPGRSIG